MARTARTHLILNCPGLQGALGPELGRALTERLPQLASAIDSCTEALVEAMAAPKSDPLETAAAAAAPRIVAIDPSGVSAAGALAVALEQSKVPFIQEEKYHLLFLQVNATLIVFRPQFEGGTSFPGLCLGSCAPHTRRVSSSVWSATCPAALELWRYSCGPEALGHHLGSTRSGSFNIGRGGDYICWDICDNLSRSAG